jgi:transposase-like protein
MAELKNRGVADILIAVVDGLKGFPGPCSQAFGYQAKRAGMLENVIADQAVALQKQELDQSRSKEPIQGHKSSLCTVVVANGLPEVKAGFQSFV